MEGGIPKVRNYHDLGIPTFMDSSLVQTLIVEKPESIGPFGAKGISEVATVPLTPAIANAIYDAVGVPVYRLPASPARIKAAMAQS